MNQGSKKMALHNYLWLTASMAVATAIAVRHLTKTLHPPGGATASIAVYALENGATKEEILEALSVVVSIRGATGVAESLRVIQLLDELGKL
jgi:alkylhydroperoxidase/carboxymuconolactone decarboxylase family protein YurZ